MTGLEHACDIHAVIFGYEKKTERVRNVLRLKITEDRHHSAAPRTDNK